VGSAEFAGVARDVGDVPAEAATAAALSAVAAAFGVRRHAVTLVAGAASRTKVLDVAGADPAVLGRLLAQ
jgi:uncharacterized protein